MTRIGSMRERVSVQQEGRTDDMGGGYALSWTTMATVSARVRPLTGREMAARGALEASQMYEVTIRRPVDYAINTGMRLLWGSVALNIRATANNDERGEFITCTCESGVVT